MTREERFKMNMIEEFKQMCKIVEKDGRIIVNKQSMLKALEQEPCEYCISKQAVLDMAEDMTDQFGNKHRVVTEGLISMLPPVTPKPKKGYVFIDDIMSVFDDFMCGEVNEEGTETFLEMLKDKAGSEDFK